MRCLLCRPPALQQVGTHTCCLGRFTHSQCIVIDMPTISDPRKGFQGSQTKQNSVFCTAACSLPAAWRHCSAPWTCGTPIHFKLGFGYWKRQVGAVGGWAAAGGRRRCSAVDLKLASAACTSRLPTTSYQLFKPQEQWQTARRMDAVTGACGHGSACPPATATADHRSMLASSSAPQAAEQSSCRLQTAGLQGGFGSQGAQMHAAGRWLSEALVSGAAQATGSACQTFQPALPAWGCIPCATGCRARRDPLGGCWTVVLLLLLLPLWAAGGGVPMLARAGRLRQPAVDHGQKGSKPQGGASRGAYRCLRAYVPPCMSSVQACTNHGQPAAPGPACWQCRCWWPLVEARGAGHGDSDTMQNVGLQIWGRLNL